MITSDNSSSGGEIEIEGRGTFENLTNSTFNLKSTEVWCRFAEDDYSVSGFQVSFAADVAAVVVVVTPVIFVVVVVTSLFTDCLTRSKSMTESYFIIAHAHPQICHLHTKFHE